MAVQQGHSERRGESYSVLYVEPLSDARTMLADVFSNLLRPDVKVDGHARMRQDRIDRGVIAIHNKLS